MSFMLNKPAGPETAVVTLPQELSQRPFIKVISTCTY